MEIDQARVGDLGADEVELRQVCQPLACEMNQASVADSRIPEVDFPNIPIFIFCGPCTKSRVPKTCGPVERLLADRVTDRLVAANHSLQGVQ